MQKILIVVDMQNDFVTGPLGSEAAQVAAKNIAAHINEYDTVIFTRDTHGPDYLDTLEGKFLPVPHCPHARMDRVKGTTDVFTLKSFADVINSLDFTKVVIYDAHSNVTPALIDRVENRPNTMFVERTLLDIGARLYKEGF